MSYPRPDRTTRSNARAVALDKCVAAFEAELDFIYRALRRNGISDSDAQDLAHELFLVMWRRWDDYDAQRPLRPWLAGIAYRIAYNHRARIGREVPAGLIDRQDEAADPESRVASTRMRGLVRRALEGLPDKQRTVLVLHELEDVSMREIAGLMDIPLFTAYSRLRAARMGFAAAVRRTQAVAAIAGVTGVKPAALLAGERDEPPRPLPPDTRRRVLSRMRGLLLLPGFGGTERAGAGVDPLAHPTSPTASPRAGHSLGVALPAVLLGGLCLLLVALVTRRRPERALAENVPAAPTPATFAPPRAAPGRVSSAVMPTAILLRPAPPRDPIVEGLGRGVVGYWRFDDAGGSALARDVSGNGNDCLLRRLDPDAGWTEGPQGGAVSLGGQGWLECPRVDAVARASTEVTIALWVRRAPRTERVQALVTRQYDRDHRDFFHFGFRDDLLLLQSSAWRVTLGAPFPRIRGRWFHVAGSLGRERVARIYVDGHEIGRKRTGPPSGERVSTPLVIGGGVNAPDQATATERFGGAIDELLIYDRVLAAEEIAALAGGTQPLLSP